MSCVEENQLLRLRQNHPPLVKTAFSHLSETSMRDLGDALRSNTHLKQLQLKDCEVGNGGAEAIADALCVNGSLKKLYIENCRIGDGDAKAIAAALSDNNTLTHLWLLCNGIGADGAKAIAAALSERNESGGRARTALSVLDLSGNRGIGDDGGGRAMAAMLRSNTSIISLNLRNCGIGDDTANALAAALVANDTIKKLDLVNNRIGDVGAKALAAANLLRLRYCRIDLVNSRSVGEECRSAFIQSERLCRNEHFDVNASDVPKAVALIKQLLPETNFISLSAIVATKAAALRSTHPPKPGRLAILNTAQRLLIDQIVAQTRPITDAAMPFPLENIGEGGDDARNAIGDGNNNKEIDRQGQGEEEETTPKKNNASDKCLRVPAQQHMKKKRSPQQRQQRLDNNESIFGMSFFDQLPWLRNNDPSVTELRIHFTPIEEEAKQSAVYTSSSIAANIYPHRDLSETSMRDLGDALRSNTHLKQLQLKDCEVGNCGGAAIADALRVNGSLKKLYIENCCIGDGGAAAIAAALSENNTLAHLSLVMNGIGADGAKAIAAALSERNESGGRMRTALSFLSLSHNEIGNDGGRALAAMLRSNTSITGLHLRNCGIEDDGAIALIAALVANDTIKKLDLSRNRIGDVGAKALAAANLLQLVCCDINLDDNVTIGEECKKELDRTRRVCLNNDVDVSDVPKYIALIEQILPETNFLSIPPHNLSAHVATNAAVFRLAHPPKPGRIAILNTAHRLLIDHIVAQTRPIPDAAMPLALQKNGEGNDDARNAIGDKNGNLFQVAIKEEGIERQGLGEEGAQETPQGNASDDSSRVPAQEMETRSGKRRYTQKDTTSFSAKRKKIWLRIS